MVIVPICDGHHKVNPQWQHQQRNTIHKFERMGVVDLQSAESPDRIQYAYPRNRKQF